MSGIQTNTELELDSEVLDSNKQQVLKGVEGQKPVTIKIPSEYIGWADKTNELTVTLSLVEDQTKNLRFLIGSCITDKLVACTRAFNHSKSDQLTANRLFEYTCLDLLNFSGVHKTLQFIDVDTKEGFCFYRKSGRVRVWTLRLPDVRLNGEYYPCFVKIAACLKVDEHLVLKNIMDISMRKARGRSNK